MDSKVIEVRTGAQETVLDLTAECERFLADVQADVQADIQADVQADGGPLDGLLHLWVPHATAGLVILETGAGSDADLLAALRELLPADDRWRHRHGSPGHGRDHVLPALCPPYATIPVLHGEMTLGTWQSVCLVDLNRDNAQRSVRLSFLRG